MTVITGTDTARTRRTLKAGGASVEYYSIPAAQEAGLGDFSRLPAALKVVLENMLRFEDGGRTVSVDDIKAFAEWGAKGGKNPREIAYRPARVLMQDFTGVPAVVDLAAMRDGIKALGGDAQKINPLNPVDLVIDHSVMIDEFGNPRAFQKNVDLEYQRNMERYWSLRYLLQEKLEKVNATVLKENLVRLDGMPLAIETSCCGITNQSGRWPMTIPAWSRKRRV